MATLVTNEDDPAVTDVTTPLFVVIEAGLVYVPVAPLPAVTDVVRPLATVIDDGFAYVPVAPVVPLLTVHEFPNRQGVPFTVIVCCAVVAAPIPYGASAVSREPTCSGPTGANVKPAIQKVPVAKGGVSAKAWI